MFKFKFPKFPADAASQHVLEDKEFSMAFTLYCFQQVNKPPFLANDLFSFLGSSRYRHTWLYSSEEFPEESMLYNYKVKELVQ